MKTSLRLTVTYAADDALPFDAGLLIESLKRITGALHAGDFSAGTFGLVCDASETGGLSGVHVKVEFEIAMIGAESDGR